MAQSVEQLIRNQQVAGSSPASSSKKIAYPFRIGYFFIIMQNLDGREGGSYFAGAKYFAFRALVRLYPTAKAAIDNCRAGRAAKSASPASSSKKIQSTLVGCIFFYFTKILSLRSNIHRRLRIVNTANGLHI